MQQKLLDSIVVLTAQRDVESLEYSMLSCLTEMFACESLALVKPLFEHGTGLVRQSLRLWRDSHRESYKWTREGAPFLPDAEFYKAFTSRRAVECMSRNRQSVLYFPIIDNDKLLTMLIVTSVKHDEKLLEAVDSLSKIYRNYHNLLSENSHDSLTGLLNRKTIDKNFNQLIATQRKHQRILVEKHTRRQRTLKDYDQVFLAIADIDHFKHINDDYGHIYGDEILLLITRLMRESFRSNDLLFRFGGEEFVVLLDPTDEAQAHKVLEKFRKHVESFDFPRVLHVTISIGFTAVADSDHLTQVVDRADKALYFAKENGRNSTFNYDHLLKSGLLNKAEFTGSVELF
jgi:diguanylate cyclase (GGDEF)-like protein